MSKGKGDEEKANVDLWEKEKEEEEEGGGIDGGGEGDGI